jgi:hypothetical protein
MRLKREEISGEPWEEEFMSVISGLGDVIGSISSGEWEGMAAVVWLSVDGLYKLTEWHWGTCEGCDPYYSGGIDWKEELEELTIEFRTKEELFTHIESDMSLIGLVERD